MTDQFDPAKLRELHEAATPGEWLLTDNRDFNGSWWIETIHHDGFPSSLAEVRSGGSEADELGSNDANAALIVALRNAVPAILAMADENAALKAEVARLREVIGEIRDLPGEINPSNYDHDDACELNRQFCYAISVASAALAGGDHEQP